MGGSPKKTEKNAWGTWAVIVVLFAIGVWPVALVMMLVKLFSSDDRRRQKAPPLEPIAAVEVQSKAQPSRARSAVKKAMKSPEIKKSNARRMIIAGAVLTVLGLWLCYDPIDMMIWMGEIKSYYVQDLLAALAIAVGGGALLGKGISMDRALKRYARYLAVLGDQEAMDIGRLARTLGYSEGRVERDLQRMIEKGYFGGRAYLNVELGYLFRSGQADEELQKRRQEAAAAQSPKETEEGYSGILRDIRRANDAIADPVLSAKIDRLEDITARIFRAVEEDPKKRDRIDTFLNYYLPTTQKLLDSYAEFEAAGVEGENLRQAKQRIEMTMDSIVKGFEHQLDHLYQADALDVDSDIRVMETMLNRDTASVEKDFGLEGGTARQGSD